MIKFSKTKSDFVTELRQSVNEYFSKNNLDRHGNTKILFKTIVMTLIYLGPYFYMILGDISSVYVLYSCWVLMGMGVAGIGMNIMHDANHGSFSANSKINKWMGKSLYLLGGSPLTWKYQHNTLHHGFTNIDGTDEDIAPIGILRFSPHKPLLKIHKYQHLYAFFFYSLMTISWISKKDFANIRKYKSMGATLSDSKSFNQILVDLIISKILYYIVFLIIPLLVLSFSWYIIIIGFIMMHLLSGFILSIIFQTAHVMPSSNYPLPNSDSEIETNWAIHQLCTTANYAPKSKMFSWFVGGLNFQIEHHLFANISHIHYRNLSPIVANLTQKYNLPYNVEKSFASALWKHVEMLKMLGKKSM